MKTNIFFNTKFKNFFTLFAFIALYKFAINVYYYLLSRYLYNEYMKWVMDIKSKAFGKKHLFKKLLSKGNLESPNIPVAQPIGFGQLATFNASIVEQFPSNLTICVENTVMLFSELKDIFKTRAVESINPLYWIETLLHLPEKTLEYLGLKKHLSLKKFLNVLWWVIWMPFIIIKFIYEDEFILFLKNLINSLLNLLNP